MTNTAAASQTVIYARDMLSAQGVTLTAEQRAELVARADRVRGIMSAFEGVAVTDKQAMNVPVYDVYARTVKIGYLTYYV